MTLKTKRWLPILVALMAMFAEVVAVLYVTIVHNVISWHWQGWWPHTVAAIGIHVVALIAFSWASYASQHRIGTAAIVVLVLALAGDGAMGLREEQGTEIKPRGPSPLAYRVTCAAFRSMPLLVVAATLARRRMRTERFGDSNP